MSGSVHRLPDLARMRSLEGRVRASSDEQVAALLASDDGRWFFVECARFMAADVARRIVTVVAGGLSHETVDALLSTRKERS